MAVILDTANILAIIPEIVATIAMPSVNHNPYLPKAGLEASASE